MSNKRAEKTAVTEASVQQVHSSEKKNRSRYLILNTLTSYGRELVDTVSFLVLIPFIIKTLGNESFGLWSLIWSFLAIFELADLGFAASVIKYVADARGRNDTQKLRSIVCTLFWIYLFLGCLVMIGIVSSLFFFNALFSIPSNQAPMAQAVLLILGIRAAMYLPLGMFRGVFVGFQKMSIANAYKAFGTVLYLISVIFFLTINPDIRVLAAVNMVTGLLPMFAIAVHSTRLMPELSLNPRFFRRDLVRQLTSFSMYFSLTQIAGMIATRADAMIIKLFLPLQSVGIYSLGMRLSEYAGMFCSHLTRALSPVFAELHGAADESNIRAANLMGTKLSVAFATPLLLGLGLLAQPLILAWTGPDFIMAVPVCQWLAASVMVGIIHGNTVSMLSMGGRQRFVAFAIIVGQILNLILSFVLVRSMGIVGVAMATFITTAPIYVFVIQGFALDYRVKSVLKFYGSTVIPALIPAMILAIGFLGFLKYRPPQNLLEVAILQGLGVGLFGIVYWYIGFNSKERTYFSQKLFKNVFRRNNQG